MCSFAPLAIEMLITTGYTTGMEKLLGEAKSWESRRVSRLRISYSNENEAKLRCWAGGCAGSLP